MIGLFGLTDWLACCCERATELLTMYERSGFLSCSGREIVRSLVGIRGQCCGSVLCKIDKIDKIDGLILLRATYWGVFSWVWVWVICIIY